MNKKGLFEKALLSIPRIILLIITTFAVIMMVNSFVVTKIDIKELEANLLVERLMFSQGGLSYQDPETLRVYPGIVERSFIEELANQESENHLDTITANYGKANVIVAARMTLEQEDKKDLIFYFDKSSYEKRWSPRAQGETTGSGSVRSFTFKKAVLIKEEATLTPGSLSFRVIAS